MNTLSSIEKKSIIVILMTFLLSLSACSPVMTDSFIEIENEAEQYKKIEQELNDLKTIKVKHITQERLEEMQKIIYENYFCYKDDTAHLKEEYHDSIMSITHETEEFYQDIDWSFHYGFISYNKHFPEKDDMEEEDRYETTTEQVILEETERFCNLLGLEYNNEENGYVIDRTTVNMDNSVDVHLRRRFNGKECSLRNYSVEITEAGWFELLFGDNQLLSIHILRPLDVVEITDYKETVLVNSPQKAYKLLTSYISAVRGTEKITVDTARVAYTAVQEEDGIYTLRPMIEFIEKQHGKGYALNIHQIDLTTKEIK